MDRETAHDIVTRTMIPTVGSSYMGGLESQPILARSLGSTVTDTDGRQYLDFQSGQMGAALGHQHPRMVRRITETMQTMLHASNAMLNMPRLRLPPSSRKCCPGLWRSRCSWSAEAIRSRDPSTSRERRRAGPT